MKNSGVEQTPAWALSAACGAASPCFAENWPGFRGPTGQGISQEKNLPLTWSLHENLAWRAHVPGIGWSSPILYEDLLIMPFDGSGAADINNIGYLTAWDGAFLVALDRCGTSARLTSAKSLNCRSSQQTYRRQPI